MISKFTQLAITTFNHDCANFGCEIQQHTVRPCLSDGVSFLTFCWINEVAGLTNHGLEAGSRTHDGHVHYVYQNEAFLKNTQLRRETSQVDKTENGKLPAVKGKPACARVNVHRLDYTWWDLKSLHSARPLRTCVSTVSELQSKVYVPVTVCARK